MPATPKLARAAFLMVALAGLSASALPVSHAQTKDKDTAKKTAKKGGKVVVREGKDGKFRYAVYNADDKYVVGVLNGYKTAKDAEKAYEELKDIIAVAKVEMGKKKESDEDDEMPAKGKKGKKDDKEKDKE